MSCDRLETLDVAPIPEARAPAGPGLRFGTAGLRAPMGAGPDQMNRGTVRRASFGLAQHLRGAAVPGARPSIVIGHDARHLSGQFRRGRRAVFAGAGIRARLVGAPVLAYASIPSPSRTPAMPGGPEPRSTA